MKRSEVLKRIIGLNGTFSAERGSPLVGYGLSVGGKGPISWNQKTNKIQKEGTNEVIGVYRQPCNSSRAMWLWGYVVRL